FSSSILTGVNIGHYRQNGQKLKDLLKNLEDIPGNHYYRISSIEPDCIDEEFLDIISREKFAKFLHLPVQSGSNRILKLMQRRYSADQARDVLSMVVQKIPDIHVGSDFIVGFPGETDLDFQRTLDLIKNFVFSNLHIFPFSKRSGSEIDSILKIQKPQTQKHILDTGDQNKMEIFEVHGDIIRSRIEELNKVQEQNKSAYIKKTSGMIFRAIVEKISDNEINFVTENYFKGELTLKLNPYTKLKKGDKIRVVYDNSLRFSIYPDS
ncbi:radical SAM protein, partial [Patescibacteria group bacterium]|nr:radical SAM protein [Patescibacteria group bacterium]